MLSLKLVILYLLTFTSFATANKVVVYWGQNKGGTETGMKEYCNDDSIDIIVIQYLSDFDGTKTPKLSLKSACSGGSLCSGVGGDIRYCQGKGKKVLLSMGGDKGLYGIGSPDIAGKLAQQMSDMFFTGAANIQPLGDVRLDGIDLAVRNKQGRFYAEFINKLREITTAQNKKIIITASPSCDYENDDLKDALDNATFDLVMVSLYDNPKCDSDPNVDLSAWDEYAKDAQTKILMGVAGSRQSAKSGYLPLENTKFRYSKFKSSYPTLFGVAINDASSAFGNDETFGKELAKQVHSSAKISFSLSIIIVALLSNFFI